MGIFQNMFDDFTSDPVKPNSPMNMQQRMQAREDELKKAKDMAYLNSLGSLQGQRGAGGTFGERMADIGKQNFDMTKDIYNMNQSGAAGQTAQQKNYYELIQQGMSPADAQKLAFQSSVERLNVDPSDPNYRRNNVNLDALGKERAKALAQTQQAYEEAKSGLPSLDAWEKETLGLSAQLPDTLFVNKDTTLGKLAGLSMPSDQRTAYTALMSQVSKETMNQLRSTFGAQFTAKEGDLFRDFAADVSTTANRDGRDYSIKNFAMSVRDKVEKLRQQYDALEKGNPTADARPQGQLSTDMPSNQNIPGITRPKPMAQPPAQASAPSAPQDGDQIQRINGLFKQLGM